MKSKNALITAAAVACITLMTAVSLFSGDIGFTPISLERVSRYDEDRIAYQQITLTDRQAIANKTLDNSYATLLIIRDKKMYYMIDGYDNAAELKTKRLLLEIEDKQVGNLNTNNINNKPDYIIITDRRVEILKKFNEEFVEKSFGKFYLNVREEFLSKHANIFRQLMIGRADSGLIVERVPFPKLARLGAPDPETKYALYVTAKSLDDRIYYAEDADGDGVCETFSVSMNDGFNWGYKSGPNIIYIYQNKDEEVKKIIGTLTNEAYSGTAEEEGILKDDMDRAFRRKVVRKAESGKTWDDRDIIQKWISEIVTVPPRQ